MSVDGDLGFERGFARSSIVANLQQNNSSSIESLRCALNICVEIILRPIIMKICELKTFLCRSSDDLSGDAA